MLKEFKQDKQEWVNSMKLDVLVCIFVTPKKKKWTSRQLLTRFTQIVSL